MMYRGNAPSRRGTVQKLTRNSDLAPSISLTNAFLREERNLDKKLQNLNTEKRLSLAQMDSEINLYRKMNQNKVEKWEDNCDMSDVSEAGSDDDGGLNTPCYDSSFKRKTVRDPRVHNSNVNNLPCKHASSFTRFTPFGATTKVMTAGDMSKQVHQPLRATRSEPAQMEKFFSRRFQDIPRHLESKKANTRPCSASGTQTQAKEIEDYYPRNRSMSIKHAEFEHIGFSHGEIQASRVYHHVGGHLATGLGGHPASGLHDHVDGHLATGLGGHPASGLHDHVDGHRATGLGYVGGGGLAHAAEPHSRLLAGKVGTHGMNGPEVVGMTREIHSHDFEYKTNKKPGFSVSKLKNHMATSKSNERSDTTHLALTPNFSSDGSHTTFNQGPHLRHNSIVSSALPKQQSNTAHSTSDWVFQNTSPRHLGIPLHNPMLFHPRFHNNLVHAPEENPESTDPNSFHVLRRCRYLRIPKPLSHDPGIDPI